MKRILVISDTHGEKERVDALLQHIDTYDKVFFLGDGWRDVAFWRDAFPDKFEWVGGNCDYDEYLPKQLILTVEKVTMLLTHGHLYNAKARLDVLSAVAETHGASVVLFGHSHRVTDCMVGAVRMLNPGHLGQAASTATFSILTIDGSTIHAETFPYLALLD